MTKAIFLGLAVCLSLFAVRANNEPTTSQDKPAKSKIPTSAVAAKTQNLIFSVTTPTGGSFSGQLRRAVRELLRKSHDGTILKLRVFTTNRSHLSEIESMVADEFRQTKHHPPVISVILVERLMRDAEVVVESTAEAKKVQNREGIAFIAGLATTSANSTLDGVQKKIAAAGMTKSDVTRLTCFCESATQLSTLSSVAAAVFPKAEISLVQSSNNESAPLVECEGIARLRKSIDEGVRLFNVDGGQVSQNYSQIALVSSPRLVFTGTELVIGTSESDLRNAYEDLQISVRSHGGELKNAVMVNNYFLSFSIRETLRAIRSEFLGSRVPAATGLLFDGLPAEGTTVGIELVTVAE